MSVWILAHSVGVLILLSEMRSEWNTYNKNQSLPVAKEISPFKKSQFPTKKPSKITRSYWVSNPEPPLVGLVSQEQIFFVGKAQIYIVTYSNL